MNKWVFGLRKWSVVVILMILTSALKAWFSLSDDLYKIALYIVGGFVGVDFIRNLVSNREQPKPDA